MRLVYPPNNHQTFEKNTFFLGSIAPTSSLTVNNTPVSVSDAGFFVYSVTLNPGENVFELTETDTNGVTQTEQRSVVMTSALPLQKLPSSSQSLLPFTFPEEDMGLQPGETLLMVCPAPPGSKVTCRVEWLMSRAVEMTPVETPLANREGVFAQLHQVKAPWPTGSVYVAHIHIPVNTPPLPTLMVHYAIQQSEAERLEFKAKGTITILPMGKRLHALVTQSDAIVRTFPPNGARRTPLLKNTSLELCGFWGDVFKVYYGPQEEGWIARDALNLLENGISPRLVAVYLIHARCSEKAIRVSIPMERLLPHDVRLESDRIRITLYGATSQCDFIHYGPGVFTQGLHQIQWCQTNPDVVEVEIKLDAPLLGLQRNYIPEETTLHFDIRTTRSVQPVPFILAIDAGHGGDEPGAAAPDGTPEKQLNLTLALMLQEALSALPEIQVVMTRSADETVSLEERVAKAIDSKAHLLISIHHNALPDGRNPLGEKGISAYYYHPFALPFAKIMQETLVNGTDFDDYGVLYDSLHVCRTMALPAVLLELGFLTHPEDAARCLDKNHQQRVVQALVQAIEKSLRGCLKSVHDER